MVVAQIVKVNKGGGCLTRIWQVISIEKQERCLDLCLILKLIAELGKCGKADLISLSL